MTVFSSNGKLLLTGEYVVLDGALALALPTKFGQSLEVSTSDSAGIQWISKDHLERIWFEDQFIVSNNTIQNKGVDQDISKRLIEILQAARQLNPKALKKGSKVETKLTFPRDWGLGTSSTLINNLANWLDINPYKLLELSFGGSGYDIACAQHDTSITYQIKNTKRLIKPVEIHPELKDSIYFIYLNQKQNSRDGIATYQNLATKKTQAIRDITAITNNILVCDNLKDFNALIRKHEQIISNLIEQPTVQGRLFSDFNGQIKSLGAWGGDFIMATSKEDPSSYFQKKGFHTVLNYKRMIKN